VSADRAFVNTVDAVMREASRRAALFVRCRRGCTPCCIGVFDITALDAVRLVRALQRLRRRRPRTADALLGRARRQWRLVAEEFPGDRERGVLSDNGRQRRLLFGKFGELPCPVLDPRTGACLLYRARPLSCRTFGLPTRCGEALLPPCRLNFSGAARAVIPANTVEPDPDDVEGVLLERLQREGGACGDTIIPAALALREWSASGLRSRGRVRLT
jgi:Fe-S-cluster containining protein